MEYLLHILILAALYTILAVSLDLLVGQTGLLSMAQGTFYGLGAYSSAVLVVTCHWPFAIGILGGAAMAVLASFAVSLPSLRLHDDYFVIATFGFQMIIFGILNNWRGLTRGPSGIPGIPRPIIFGWNIDSSAEFLILSLLIAVIAYIIVWRLSSSPFGRVLHSIREDEVFATSVGKNTLSFKVAAFAVSAGLAALAGSLFAHYITYIDPSCFTMMESILIISMVVIGGAGSKWGPLLGAVVMVMLPEALRLIGLPSSVAANLRQVLYGAVLIIMMLFHPRGLIGKYGFGR